MWVEREEMEMEMEMEMFLLQNGSLDLELFR